MRDLSAMAFHPANTGFDNTYWLSNSIVATVAWLFMVVGSSTYVDQATITVPSKKCRERHRIVDTTSPHHKSPITLLCLSIMITPFNLKPTMCPTVPHQSMRSIGTALSQILLINSKKERHGNCSNLIDHKKELQQSWTKNHVLN